MRVKFSDIHSRIKMMNLPKNLIKTWPKGIPSAIRIHTQQVPQMIGHRISSVSKPKLMWI